MAEKCMDHYRVFEPSSSIAHKKQKLESYPTISALGPRFTEIQSKLQKLEYADTVSYDPALITCYSTHLISSARPPLTFLEGERFDRFTIQ